MKWMDDEEFEREVNAAYPPAAAGPPPADNYVPQFTGAHRHRDDFFRRRQWSRFSVLVNSNRIARNAQERRDLRYLMLSAASGVFQSPQRMSQIMRTVDIYAQLRPNGTVGRRQRAVAPGQPPPPGFTLLGGYASVTHDQFDNQHVVHHEFSVAPEFGEQGRSHANINYRVLHDSAFQIDRQLFEHYFRQEWNEVAAVQNPEWVIPEGQRLYVSIKGFTDYFTEEYDNKENPEFRGWWTRRPLYAANERHDGGSNAMFWQVLPDVAQQRRERYERGER